MKWNGKRVHSMIWIKYYRSNSVEIVMLFKILNSVIDCTLVDLGYKSKSLNGQMERILFPNKHSHQNPMVVFIKSSYTNNPTFCIMLTTFVYLTFLKRKILFTNWLHNIYNNIIKVKIKQMIKLIHSNFVPSIPN